MITHLLFALLIGALFAPLARADLGAVLCWETNEFDDTFAIWAMSPTGDATMFALPAVTWRGLTAYQMNGSTSARLFEATPEVVRVSVVMDNPSGFFGENPNCRVRMVFQYADLRGAWTIDCTGGVKPFTVSGTAALVACQPDTSPTRARAMGAPRLAGQ
jgi:hypothetical protein